MPLPRCFMDVSVDDQLLGRVVFEIFDDVVPKTATNFLTLCAGSHVSSSTRQPLTYRGSPIHRIIDGFMVQGGDVTKGNGTGGESIYGGAFADERLEGPGSEVDREGLLVMANRGKDTNKSQWFVTLGPAEHLNGKHVVFGRVVSGMNHIQTTGKLPTDSKDRPTQSVIVSHCGELELRKPASSKPAPRARTPSVSASSASRSVSRSRSRSRSPPRRSGRDLSDSRSPPPRRRYASETPSDSASESEDERARRRREKKARRAAREQRREDRRARKNGRSGKEEKAGNGGREETEAELDARLEREEKERLALAAEERRKQKEEEMVKAKETGGVVYKGRGAMRYRDPEVGGMSAWGGSRGAASGTGGHLPRNYDPRAPDVRPRRAYDRDRAGQNGTPPHDRDGHRLENVGGPPRENAVERGAGRNGRIQYNEAGRWARGAEAKPEFERQRQRLDDELDNWGTRRQRDQAQGGEVERDGNGDGRRDGDMDDWKREERKSAWARETGGGRSPNKRTDEQGREKRGRAGSEVSGGSDMVLDLED